MNDGMREVEEEMNGAMADVSQIVGIAGATQLLNVPHNCCHSCVAGWQVRSRIYSDQFAAHEFYDRE